MQLTIRYFAGHRDITGHTEERLAYADGTTVQGVWELLVVRYPGLAPYSGRVLFAVNRTYAAGDTVLNDGDELACIPPVSGGSGLFAITDAPLDPATLVALVQTPAAGALVTFAGIVRDNFGGRATEYLVYEAYADLAIPVLAEIASAARAQFGCGAVAIHHRIGRLAIGETAVLVVVAAAHRRAAFAAGEWVMDTIKERAPIWKREHWADGGSDWAEAR